MAAGDLEWAALGEALKKTEPLCENDDRYVFEREDLHPDELAFMKRQCRTCPLADLCAAYAIKARPTGGMWAGSYYKPRTRKGTTQ